MGHAQARPNYNIGMYEIMYVHACANIQLVRAGSNNAHICNVYAELAQAHPIIYRTFVRSMRGSLINIFHAQVYEGPQK